MQKILLKDATLVTAEKIIKSDLLIEDKYIAKINPHIEDQDAYEVNCKDLLVLPGMIDAHVHFREPGLISKADIFHESRAAALGGVTSFMDMPNTMPPTVDAKSLLDKHNIAKKDSLINWSFYLGATPKNLEEVRNVDTKLVPAIKIYMGSTTGNLLLDEDEMLLKIFEASPLMICTHCEDSNIINKNLQFYKEKYGENIPYNIHPIIRNALCCLQSSKKAIDIALKTNKKLHIMHLSSKDEVDYLQYFAKGDLETRLISAEACVPHLMFNASQYDLLKGYLKCNPSVKEEKDRLSLIQGLKLGIISTVGTDHAPHEKETKLTDSYIKCPSGIPSIQYALLSLLDLWKRRELTLEEVVKVSSHNVAKRFNIENRGDIKEGYFADLAIVNVMQGKHVDLDDIASLCKWTPFEGYDFRCNIQHTIANGSLVVENGIVKEETQAEALTFNH